MSPQIDCPYRANVRREGDLGVANCELLSQITGVENGPLLVVREDACAACSKDARPTPEVLNPVTASLLHKMCEDIIAQGGVNGCDISKAQRLQEWSYAGIPVVPSKSNPLGVWRGFHASACDQHAYFEESSSVPCIHLTRSLSHVIGQGFHRSGWPYAVASLAPLYCKHGILLDDFIEQRFCYESNGQVYTTPWVGIFHHPGRIPTILEDSYSLDKILEGPAWKESEKHLRGAIALSEHLAKYLSQRLQVPVVAVKHPSEIPDKTWSEHEYLRNPRKKLVQFGWYLRNTRAIHQLPKLPHHEKFRCLPDKPWIVDYDSRLLTYWDEQKTRAEHGHVTELGYVPHQEYDSLMTSAVALTELFEASANNVVIECIARNTPLVVNRNPAAVEYLTPEYPLFFDDLREVPALLTDDRIIAAHRYLRDMDKQWLTGESFCNSIRDALTKMDISRPVQSTDADIEGWYDARFDTILRQISDQQGPGHLAEIGVHYGKSFIHLSQMRRPEERSLAVDCFDEQHHNRSFSGSGKKATFLRNVRNLSRVTVLEGNSLDFTGQDYLAAIGGPIRIFHVDGGHDAETALHDLTQAAQALTKDGVLVIDDVFNQDWPAVSQALYKFIASSDMKPFAIGYNKVCLSRRSFDLQSPRYVKPWLGTQVQIM